VRETRFRARRGAVTERALPVRHAPARLGEREAEERACRSTGTVGAEWVRRRVWVPFWLHRRRPALPASHPYADTPMPSPTRLASGPPSAAEDDVIPVASQAVPHVYFPFWHLRAGGADILVCATSGEVMRSSRGGLRRAEIQRAIAVLALAFFFGTMATFVAEQMTLFAVLAARALGPLAQLLAWLAASSASASGLFLVVRLLLRPALDESAMEIAAGQPDASAGPAVARLARWVGGLALLIVGYEVLLLFLQSGTALVPLALTVVAGAALARVGFGLGRTTAAPPVLDEGVRWGHPWAAAFRTYAHVLGYALAGVLANALFARAGLYLAASLVFGEAIESNQAEILLVTVAVVIGVATSELEERERWALMVGLAVPEITKPFVGPALSIAFQFLSVTLVNQWIEQRLGSHKPLRQTVVRSLEIEAALVAGSLGGRLFALLLLGTPGWSVGDVIGGLVMASLLMVPQRESIAGSAPPDFDSISAFWTCGSRRINDLRASKPRNA
jgi:hypothetical protein